MTSFANSAILPISQTVKNLLEILLLFRAVELTRWC